MCNWKKPSDRKQVLHSPVDFLEREYLWSWQWKWPCSICSGWAKVSYHLYNPSSTQKHWLQEKSALTTVVTCVSPMNNVIVQIFRLFFFLRMWHMLTTADCSFHIHFSPVLFVISWSLLSLVHIRVIEIIILCFWGNNLFKQLIPD